MEEGNFQGDLADVVRASGGCGMARDVASSSFPPPEVPLNMVEMSDGLFGDPFSSMRDPLQGIGHVDMSTMLPPHQFRISTTTSTILDHQTQNRIHIPDDQMRINSTLVRDMPARVLNPSSPKQAPSFIDTTARVQMSSPPTNPTLKRRKSQPKKVVCIPAPTAINSRQGGGEVVPSDLWAWRKYGQKPIKGSPYPRGYYRCSSSKGCSARKQVERSRTDPNMLVITYTSEHNHPWPTQRNALAGSSRISAAPVPTTSSPLLSQPNKTANVKEEITDAHQTLVSNEDSFTNDTDSNSSVKRDQDTIINGMIGIYEANRVDAEDHGKGVVPNQLMMNDLVIDYERSYRPVMMQEDHNLGAVDGDGDDQDFFADLRELEADPLNDLLFSRCGGNKSMLDGDPFGCLFDWQSNSNPTTTTTTTTTTNTNTHNRSPHQNS